MEIIDEPEPVQRGFMAARGLPQLCWRHGRGHCPFASGVIKDHTFVRASRSRCGGRFGPRTGMERNRGAKGPCGDPRGRDGRTRFLTFTGHEVDITMLLMMIDNHDSFTLQPGPVLLRVGVKVKVVRNDEITLDGSPPRRIVWFSRRPCSPAEAGIACRFPALQGPKLPILGRCLGHQSIGAALGGRLFGSRAKCTAKPVITTDQRASTPGLPSSSR